MNDDASSPVRTGMRGPGTPSDVETRTNGVASMLAARRGRTGRAFVTYRNREPAW